MLLARMSQNKNRNRRCHLVDELKDIPQNKKNQTNKQTKTSKTETPPPKKKKKLINKPN